MFVKTDIKKNLTCEEWKLSSNLAMLQNIMPKVVVVLNQYHCCQRFSITLFN